MSDEFAAARSHPAVVASIVIAAVAVTALAVAAIAYLLGWIPAKASAPTPAGMASPGQQVTGTLPDVVLLPGETLVTPPEAKALPAPATTAPAATPIAPTTPKYAKSLESAPRKPDPAPPAYAPPASRSGTPAPSYAPAPPRAAPAAPSVARKETPLTSYERSTRSICINCGTIASIRSVADNWEVRVRFEDGSSETIRYAERPRMRIGDRVLLEDGRLVPD